MLGLFALQYWGIYTGYAAGTTAGKRPSPQPAPRQPAPAPRNPAPAPRPAQAPSGSSQRKQGDLYDEFLAFLGESGIGTPPPAKKEEKSFDAPVDKPIAKPVDKPYTPSDYTPEPEPESTSEPSDNEWI